MTEKTNKKTFPNLYTGTFIAVIALHAITGWALANVKTPEVAIPELVEAPPLEIEIIKPIIEKPEVVEVQPQAEPVIEPIPEPKAEPKSEPVSTVALRPEPVPQVEPETKPEPKPKSKKPLNTQQPKQEVQDKRVVEQERQAILNAQKQAELKAQESARLQAQEQERLEAQEQARLNAQEEARIKAEEDRRKAAEQARIKAEEAAKRKAAEQAANSEPVSFTATSADWASTPRFSFPNDARAKRRTRPGQKLEVVLRLRVNKQGAIESVNVAKSSGNPSVDQAAQQQVSQGRFNPFKKNGAAVVGNVTLPIVYEVPR
ncbi:TonB family protein [Psychrobacter sp. 1Y11]|uniref:TonB family protein n=1 Tax=Psychrobacter sp. 1Y11 TaxID=3457446 RepID=UPI003FD348D3